MNNVQQSIRDYINMLVNLQGDDKDNIYSRLQKDGQFFNVLKHRHSQYPLLKIGHCFYNAYRTMRQNQELEYAEGFAYSGVITLHHAWNVDGNGNVIDTTWRNRGKYGKFSTGREYFGIIIPRNELDDVLHASGTYGYWKVL